MATQTPVRPQAKRRFVPRWRKATWALAIFNFLALLWLVVGIASVPPATAANCNGLDQATCNAARDIGTGLGVTAIVIVWFIGFVVLGLVWLMSKPKHRQCPRCGHDVKKGLTVCKSCSFDFAQATSQMPLPPPVLH
jgi:beta-lactamase regulating signal transducer with metallopeptidase domain